MKMKMKKGTGNREQGTGGFLGGIARGLFAGAALALFAPSAWAGSSSAAWVDTRAFVLAPILPEGAATCEVKSGTDCAYLATTFNTDVSDAGTYVLPDDLGPLAFDVNGKNWTGAAGAAGSTTTAGDDGSPVFKVGTNTTVAINGTSGSITGGAGGDGKTGGAGAYAFVKKSNGAKFMVTDPAGLVQKGADGKSATQIELEKIFDVEGTPTTVEPVLDDNGDLVGHTVILGQDYGPLALSNDFGAVTIDLNGWTIKGVDGTTESEGGNGGPAIVIAGACGAAMGDTAITVTNAVPAGQLWVGGPIWAESNLGDSGVSAHPEYGGLYKFDDAGGAVTSLLGTEWRVPSKEDFQELLNEDVCDRVWDSDKKGMIFTGKGAYSSNSVFLPAAGYNYGSGSSRYNAGSYGCYWSSSPSGSYAYYLNFYPTFAGYFVAVQSTSRSDGRSVRAVRDAADDGRPAAGPVAAIVGGRGGAGNPAGAGADAIVDGNGDVVAVEDPQGLVAKGADGQIPLPYMDWDETAHELVQKWANAYEIVTDGTAKFDRGKTYAVQGDVTNTAGGITVRGTVESPTVLILCDGAKLVVQDVADEKAGFAVGVSGATTNALVICGQSGGTGALEVSGGSNGAGIGGANAGGGSVTVNGGIVTAVGGDWAAGIGGGCYGDGGAVTVNGGTVTAVAGAGDDEWGSTSAIGAGYGGSDMGTVAFGADFDGKAILADVALVTPDGYSADHGAKFVRIPVEAVVFVPQVRGVSYVVSNGTEEVAGAFANGTNAYVAAVGDTLELYFTLKPNFGWISAPAENPMSIEVAEGANTVALEDLPSAGMPPVQYLDWDGEKMVEKTTIDYEIVTHPEEEMYEPYVFEPGRTYVVNSEAMLEQIRIDGTTENPSLLILCDGAKLDVPYGIIVETEGYTGVEYALVVCGQSDGTGLLTATGDYDAAGIGGCGEMHTGGAVTINGGTVIATGGEDGGAGIGGGDYSSGGTVTINGGTVTATGSNSGAGIGGGNSSYSGNVTINGGTVIATGGEDGGAGIGGGEEMYLCGNVTVNGGTVIATGGVEGGAGIEGRNGNVTVNGGTVIATGTMGSAGVAGESCTVTVNGGTVAATGSMCYYEWEGEYECYAGAGIGAGAYDDAGLLTVNVNGGTVTAVGGECVSNDVNCVASGIGGGYCAGTRGAAGKVKFNGGFLVVTGETAEAATSVAQEDYERDHSARYAHIETDPAYVALMEVFNDGRSVVKTVTDATGRRTHTVILGADYEGGMALQTDLGAVMIDLNGWTISGTNGVDGTATSAGGDGGAAITVAGECGADAGNTVLSVTNGTDGVELPGVQLWKGGPRFATCNVGAARPEEFGYYFWWGDTVGYTNSGSGWVSVDGSGSSIVFMDDEISTQTYGLNFDQLKAGGWIDDSGNLAPDKDAATAHLGAPWRMPAADDLKGLVENCTQEWTDDYKGTGVSGYIVTGRGAYASDSIFLPAVGYGSSLPALQFGGERGYYRSSTPKTDYAAESINFSSSEFFLEQWRRYCGFAVRPVQDAVRPDAGPSAVLIGGNGGKGNPAGKGAFAVADATGAEVAVVASDALVAQKGTDGTKLLPDVVATTEFSYDGTEKRPVAATNVYVFAGDVSATNAGTYTVSITPAAGHTWGDGSTAATNISWKILPRAATLTSGTQQWTYDGRAHSNMTVTAENFVAGEGVAANGFATITDVGTVPNAFAYTLKGNTPPANYSITCVTGTLAVTSATLKPEDDPDHGYPAAAVDPTKPSVISDPDVPFSAFDTTNCYDGVAHTIDTNRLEQAYADKFLGNVPSFGYALTSNGVYGATAPDFTDVTVTSLWFKVSAANFEDVIRPAKVIVTNRAVTVSFTAADKVFDGTAAATCAATNFENVVEGEGFALDTSAMSFAFSDEKVGANKTVTATGYSDDKVSALEGTKKSNYTFAFDGTATASITAQPAVGIELLPVTESYVYDGTGKEPEPGVTNTVLNVMLTKGEDYDYVWADNTNATDAAKVIAVLKGDYAGVVTNLFTIAKAAIAPTVDPSPFPSDFDPTDPSVISDPDVPFSAFDTTNCYDGAAHTIDTNRLEQAYADKFLGNVPSFGYALTSNGVYGATAPDFTDVTVTSLWFKVSAANFEDVIRPAKVVILKAAYDMSEVRWTYEEPFEYDGTEKSVALANLPDGVAAIYSGDTAAIDVGDYVAQVANFAYDAKNYEQPTFGKTNCEWSIVIPMLDPSASGTVTYPKPAKDTQYLKAKSSATWKAKAFDACVFAGWEWTNGVAPKAFLALSENERRNPSLKLKLDTDEAEVRPTDVAPTWARIDEDRIQSVELTPSNLAVVCRSYVKASVSGLPSGLKFNKKTLAITGVAKKNETKTVKVSVKNASGYTFKQSFRFSVEEDFSVTVEPAEDAVPTGEPAVLWGEPSLGKVKGSKVVAAGKKATIKATPAKNCIFLGWYEDPLYLTPATNNVPYLPKGYLAASQSVVVPEGGLHLFARFVELKAWAQGTFDGTYIEDGTNAAGTVTFTVSNKGKVSGKTLRGGKSVAFSAAAIADCVVTRVGEPVTYVVRPAAKDGATLELRISLNEETGLGKAEILYGEEADAPFATAVQNGWKLKPAALPAFPTGKDALGGVVTNGVDLALTFGAKGVVKVAGTVGGAKVSAKTQVLPLAWTADGSQLVAEVCVDVPKAGFCAVYDVRLTVGPEGVFKEVAVTD